MLRDEVQLVQCEGSYLGSTTWRFGLELVGSIGCVKAVLYELHSTFKQRYARVTEPPFAFTSETKGVFTVKAYIQYAEEDAVEVKTIKLKLFYPGARRKHATNSSISDNES